MPRLVREQRRGVGAIVADWALARYEDISTLDLDGLSSRILLPTAVALNAVYWLSCYQLQVLQEHSSTHLFRHNALDERLATTGRTLAAVLWALTNCLRIISFLNAVYCFASTKNYQVAATARLRESKGAIAFLTRQAGRLLLFWRHGKDDDDAQEQQAAHLANTQVLKAWNPSLASLRLLAIFSPVHAYLGWHFAHEPPVLAGLAMLTVLLTVMVEKYDGLLHDRRVIYGQVLRDYDRNFVEPRLSVMKRDVGVGTRADDDGVYVEVHTPKVGIIDSRTARDGKLPRSASLVRMYDWGSDPIAAPSTTAAQDLSRASSFRSDLHLPSSPNMWAQASPAKRMASSSSMGSFATGLASKTASAVQQSSRRTIASPRKEGSPTKLYRAAGWSASTNDVSTSGSERGQSGRLLSQMRSTAKGQQSGLRRSKTLHELASNTHGEW